MTRARQAAAMRPSTGGPLRLKARDVMSPNPICVKPTMSLPDFAHLLDDNNISGAPVIDESGRILGVASKTDLMRRCLQGTLDAPPLLLFESLAEQAEQADGDSSEALREAVSSLQVQDFMTEDPLVYAPEDLVKWIGRRMCAAHVHRVIVVDDERTPIGVITSLDLLASFVREAVQK